MKRTKIIDVLKSTEYGKDICVKGWVRTHRSSKAVDFIALNDGSTIKNVQIVVDPTKFDEQLLKDITTGACICAVGTLVESQGAGQSSEIQATQLEVYGLCGNDYPMQKKGQSFEAMRKNAHMRLRTNTFGAVMRIRHNMDKEFRCIATSATLGSKDGKDGLAKFAEALFDEPFSADDVITTERVNREPADGARLFLPDEYLELKRKVEGLGDEEKEKVLYSALANDMRLFRVYEALKTKPKKIEEVASVVFDDLSPREGEAALIDLIELSAAAKKSEYESFVSMEFEHHFFSVYSCWDSYLKGLYGDYMQLPPVEKRKTHDMEAYLLE